MTATDDGRREALPASGARRRATALLVIHAAALTALVLRPFLLPRGIPLYEDLSFATEFGTYLPRLSHVWDFTRSARTPLFAQWLLLLPPAWFGLSGEIYIKAVFAVAVFTSCLSMALLVRKVLDGAATCATIAGALLASSMYVLNPWAYRSLAGYLNLYIGYALVPLIVLLWHRAMVVRTTPRRIACAALCGLVASVLTIDVRNLMFLVLVAALLGVGRLLVGPVSLQDCTRAAVTTAVAGAFVFLFFLPAFLALGSGAGLNRLGLEALPALSSRSNPINTARVGGFFVRTPLDRVLDGPGLLTAVSFLPLVLGITPLLVKRTRSSAAVVLLGFVIFAALAAGPSGPTRGIFEWVISESPLVPFANVLREPPKAGWGTAFFAASMVGLVPIAAFAGRRPILRVVMVSALIAISLAITMQPMLAGRYQASLTMGSASSDLRARRTPAAYADMRAHLEQSCSGGKVIWLPVDYGQFKYRWNGGNNISDFHWNTVPVPGFAVTASDDSRYLWYLYVQRLLSSSDTSVGAAMRRLGVSCVAYHADYDPSQELFGDSAEKVRAALERQVSLRRTFERADSFGRYEIYAVDGAVSAPRTGRKIAVSGGFDLHDVVTGSPPPLLRSGVGHTIGDGLDDGDELDKSVVLALEDEATLDLALARLPENALLNATPKDLGNPNYGVDWTGPGILGTGGPSSYFNSAAWPDKYDHLFARSPNLGASWFATTAYGATLNVNVPAATAPTVLAVHYVTWRSGGELLIRVDGIDVRRVSTQSPRSDVEWAVVPLPGSTTHRAVEIVNLSGANAVGAIAHTPDAEYENLQTQARSLIASAGSLAWIIHAGPEEPPRVLDLPAASYAVFDLTPERRIFQVRVAEQTLASSDGSPRVGDFSVEAGSYHVDVRSDGPAVLLVATTTLEGEPVPVGHVVGEKGEVRDGWEDLWTERDDGDWRCRVGGSTTEPVAAVGNLVACPATVGAAPPFHERDASFQLGRRLAPIVLAIGGCAFAAALLALLVRPKADR